MNPEHYDQYRVAGDGDDERRGIAEVPPEETLAATTDVLRHQISLPLDALVSETARALGYERTGQPIQNAIRKAVELAEQRQKLIRDAEGRVQLRP